MAGVDKTQLSGANGLVKHVQVDGEVVTARSAKDLRELDAFLKEKDAECSRTKKSNILQNCFAARLKSDFYPSD